MYIYRVA